MRRRSSNACPRSCKRIPPEQGPGHPQLKTPQPAAASSAAAAPTAARKPRRQLPLNPTTCPFAGQRIRSEPGAGAAGGPPKGEAQSIPKKLAAFSGAGGRPIGRANANALAAKGNAGEGWWRNQWARAVIWVTVSKPWSSSGVGWGASVPLGQRMSRRRGGLNHHPAPPPDCYQGQASHSPAADVPSNRATNTWGRFWPNSTTGRPASPQFAPPRRSWPFAQG